MFFKTTLAILSAGAYASTAMAADVILRPGESREVNRDTPMHRYYLVGQNTLNVSSGAQTGRILATDNSRVNINDGRVHSVGENALSLYNSHAEIDASTITAFIDPSRPGRSLIGIALSGDRQASSARITNSKVQATGRGINISQNATLDLANTYVEGLAGADEEGPIAGGVGLVIAGATASVRAGSVITGDNNGIVMLPDVTDGSATKANLVLDQSSVIGREGSAIKVLRHIDDEDVNIEINNGSTLSGGNGMILEVSEGARANAAINNSHLTGNIVADKNSTLNISLADHASLTGSIENAASLKIDASSSWSLTGDSSVDKLNLSDGTVNLRGPGGSTGFNRLQLGELSGSGTFVLGADLATGQGDFIDVSGKASGEHRLLLESTGTDPNAAVIDHQVVHTGEGSTSQFDLIGGQVDFGTFAYELEQRGDDWFLVRKGNTTTPGTRTVTGLFSAAPTVWYGEATTLRSRMGELRNGNTQGGGWLRTYGNKHKVSAGAGADYNQVQQGISFGADAPLPSNGSQWLLGVTGGYSRSDLDLSAGTTGKVDSFHLGMYSTWLADDGLYIDALLKANRFQNTSDVRMSDGRKAKGKYSNNGIGASIEVGKHIKLDDGWFVEPYTQLSTLWVDGASYNLDNGMRASAANADSLLGKVGSHVGRTFPLDKGGFVQPYVKVAAAHEFARNNQVKVNDNKFDNDLSGSRIELGAGVAAQVTDTVQVNAGFDYMKGNNIEQPWGVNLGARYSW